MLKTFKILNINMQCTKLFKFKKKPISELVI